MDYDRGAALVGAVGEATTQSSTGSALAAKPASLLAGQVAAARRLRKSETRRTPRHLAYLLHLPVPSTGLLIEYFDLTPAEARLAQMMAQGNSLDEAAQALGIKMSTARTQLKSIFAKTHTSRQGKLVAILSRVAHLR